MMAERNYSSYKSPPLMRQDLSYADWKKELDIWSDFTDLENTQKAGAVFLTLKDKARQVVLDGTTRDELKADTGLQSLITCLDTLFKKDETQSGFSAYETFINYKRSKSMTIEDYLIEFNLKYSKLKVNNMTLPDGVLAYYLLKCANLTEEQNNICRATCSDLKYANMKTMIERVTSTLGNTAQAPDQDIKVSVPLYTDYDFEHYGYDEESADIEDTYDEQLPYMEAFYNAPYSNPRPHYNTTANNRPKQNPLDEYGNPSKCTFCRSIYHWVQNCPDASRARPSSRGRAFGYRRAPRGRRGGFAPNAI